MEFAPPGCRNATLLNGKHQTKSAVCSGYESGALVEALQVGKLPATLGQKRDSFRSGEGQEKRSSAQKSSLPTGQRLQRLQGAQPSTFAPSSGNKIGPAPWGNSDAEAEIPEDFSQSVSKASQKLSGHQCLQKLKGYNII